MTTADFNLYLECVNECRRWGQLAGIFNEPESLNPYPPGSYFSDLWLRHRALAIQKRNDELAEQHERDFAERCEREGDAQLGWWEWAWELFFGATHG